MLEKFPIIRLEPDSKLKPFDCGDLDLNDFFHTDTANYARELLAVTYAFENNNETVAFFSVLNDAIINKDRLMKKTISNKLIRKIPNEKRRPRYPAVKVGRLGINRTFQGQGIGSEVLDFVKSFFTVRNKTGCRFITVDAYNCDKVVSFYKRNGFKFLTDQDKKDDTRLMYFDLKTFLR
ncbi:MAG: GNAT family N-acetyltransferase [Nitrospirae bacterium]|nr:GNAT family N-acetyltransferase [Nitrospirota bacterium]